MDLILKDLKIKMKDNNGINKKKVEKNKLNIKIKLRRRTK